MHSGIYALIAVAVLAMGPLADMRMRAEHSAGEMSGIAPEIEGCRRTEWDARWAPKIIAPDVYVQATYLCGGERVHFAAAQYLTQAQGREAVSQSHVLLPKDLKARLHDGGVRSFDQQHLSVQTHRSANAESWAWFAVGTSTHTGRVSAKLDEAWRALRFESVPTALFVLTTESDDPERGAVMARVAPDVWDWYRDRAAQ